tara:strand:- start:2088 stop:4097 length:2010 start_codon:yes stop_codon:yes gene_type:complete
MKSYLGWAFIFFLFFTSCVPVPEDNHEEVIIDLADEEVQKIYSLQNRQSIDSLKSYFQHKSATYRYLAASAFSSIQSESSIEELESLLFDKNIKVRTAAAYSLGQTGNLSSAQSLLEAFDSDEDNVNSEINSTILEAVGKCGDQKMLEYMASTSTYNLEDNQLLLGQARGIYRFALRGITSPEGTTRMAEMVINSAFPIEARVIAANYILRARNIDLDEYKFQLLQVLNEEPDPRIRICLANALAKISDSELYNNLLTTLKSDQDNRVKVNLIRGLRESNEPLLVDSLFPYISHSDFGVALNALSVINLKAQRRHTTQLRELTQTIADSEIRAELLRASLASTPFSYRNTKGIISQQIINEYNNAATDYKKAFFLSALSADPANYKRILDLLAAEPSNVVRTMSIDPLTNILSSSNFRNLFRTRRAQETVKTDIMTYLKNQIDGGDLGETAAAAIFLTSNSESLKEVFTDSLFFANKITQLTGSESIEARKSLKDALAALTSYNNGDNAIDQAKPLNWSTLKNISNTPIAIIVTTKGRITVELSPNLTPATVANFIELTDNNYYDRKYIHRVVSNFVIQGGCPRGDGYGSLDYTIRSEFPQRYYDSEGYIGMASAGIHTEGVQWFITHSPTPHLDGRYTIFGKVTEGMDVVKDMRVGDIIQDIRILKYN